MNYNSKIAIPIVGAAGNVGKGIVSALENAGHDVLPIDPQINSKLEDLSDREFVATFSQSGLCVYVADCGNRDEYAADQKLYELNNKRFAQFCNRVSKINSSLVIWYIGGSWTKRKPNAKWEVGDNSPNKDLKDCNPYEKAKISAEKNAQKLSRKTKIRFVDWPSVVPNLAPNFSITKMVAQAIKEGEISYSPGEFGRPLADSSEAGEALVVLIDNDDTDKQFKKYLIPGYFVPFSLFAITVKKVVEAETNKHVRLTEIENSPDFLKSKCKSDYFHGLGFKISKKRTVNALVENAEIACASCYTSF